LVVLIRAFYYVIKQIDQKNAIYITNSNLILDANMLMDNKIIV